MISPVTEGTQNPGTSRFAADLTDCIRDCTQCYQTCLETFNYSLLVGGRHVESVHLRLLADCAEICQVAANFMIRGSDLHQRICEVCAVVCRDCAKDCERYAVASEGSGAPMSEHSGKPKTDHEKVDDQLKYCAQVCRQCADSCEKMANMPLVTH